MKRKLLNGLLLASALVGVGTFQSCKDYEADVQTAWSQENLSLQDKINLLGNRLDELQRAQDACKTSCEGKFAELFQRMTNTENNFTQLSQKVTGIYLDVDDLKNNTVKKTEIQNIIKQALIEYGWPTDENGEIDKDAFETILSDIANLKTDYLALGDDIDLLKGYCQDYETRITDLENKIRNLNPGTNWTEEEIRQIAEDEAERQIDILKDDIATQLNNLQTTLQDNIDSLGVDLAELKTTVTNMGTKLSQVETTATQAFNKVTTLETTVGNLSDLLDTLNTEVLGQGGIKEQVIALQQKVNTLRSDLDDLNSNFTDLRNEFDALAPQVETNKSDIAAIKEQLKGFVTKDLFDQLVNRVSANESAIQALTADMQKVLKIYDRLNKMVTGIIIESAENPLFGTFSLPIGVENQMLVNYYGRYEGVQDLNFPSVGNTTTTEMLSAAEYALLKDQIRGAVTLTNGEYLMNGNLGKVYLTINPTNVDLSGVDLVLTQSNGDVPGVTLKNVRPSTDALKFGVSRANDNGFYVADAVLEHSSSAINSIKVEVVDGLKSSVKNLLKDRTKKNVYELMRAVYDQIAQGTPAYAVKHSWTVDDGMGPKNYSVLSGYDLSMLTFKPLSFNTYAGQSIDKKFKHHGPIRSVRDMLNDLIKNDKYHFSLEANIDLDADDYKTTFNLKDVDVKVDYQGEIWAETSGIDIYDEDGNYVGKTGTIRIPVSSSDLDNYTQSIISQLQYEFNKEGGMLEIWDKQLEDQYNKNIEKLCKDVTDQVNKALEDLEGSINKQIDVILNDLKDDIAGKTQKYVDKLNSFLEKYNKVVDKLNNFLEDPNHYLQVTMGYYGKDNGIHLLSDDRQDPSILKRNGGNAITLVATSYTAEVAAPAYKKFVAITAGWDTKGNKVSDADIKALNKQGSLCMVVPGGTKRVALQTSDLKTGYTYELVYTSVDYSGYTSTNHFYVKVK